MDARTRTPGKPSALPATKPRHFSRYFQVLAFFSAMAGCSSLPGSGGSGSDRETWACTDTPKSTADPCHCQMTPIGGGAHIVDHCDGSSVPDPGASGTECCKQWIVLN